MKVERKNELALVIAYYISKYDRIAIGNLGYKTFNQAYRDIEARLGVKASSLKNRRDEFDPIHENARVGWYQRAMSPSRVRIVQQFGELSEPALRSIVNDILSHRTETLASLQLVFEKNGGGHKGPPARRIRLKPALYVPRGPTGRRAEEIFIKHFHTGTTPLSGAIEDYREQGLGYDFLVIDNESRRYVEVKGLDSTIGGICFTDKEWTVAMQEGESYFLVVVSDIGRSPVLSFIQNPGSCLSPRKHISQVVSVSWSLSTSQLPQIPKLSFHG